MIKDRTTGDEMTQEERWTTEHIDISGHLNVPMTDYWERAPEREGWVCFWVNVNLDRPHGGTICKVYKYKRVEETNNVT
jgi:hypothetical protein